MSNFDEKTGIRYGVISLQDILDIDNCEIYFFDHYKQDRPEGKHLYWGEL